MCPLKSRVIGVGPQIGYIFPAGNLQGYLNLKAYGEFDSANRPDDWNVWLALALSRATGNADRGTADGYQITTVAASLFAGWAVNHIVDFAQTCFGASGTVFARPSRG